MKTSAKNHTICNRCIMDTSDPEIVFDQNGICNHCSEALFRLNSQIPSGENRDLRFRHLIDVIKREGKNKEYDCIIGVSGGIDSSMTAWEVKRAGLHPLAIHFDNGWNSELSVSNIKTILDKLGIDLFTYVVDWDEFKDLQLSFLKASLANCEAPTDHGITALLFSMAAKKGVRYILSGSNLVTESIMPISWGHYNQDLRLLRAVHKRFGTVPLKTMPTISIGKYFFYVFGKRIRQIPFLNYIDYNKDEAKQLLIKELGWRDYGGKHYESIWTRFFQSYYLPVKFGFDKRRAHLSSMICASLISRSDALKEMEKPICDEKLMMEDKMFVIKKFGLNEQTFNDIINNPPKNAVDYPNNYFLFHRLSKYKNIFRKIATSKI